MFKQWNSTTRTKQLNQVLRVIQRTIATMSIQVPAMNYRNTLLSELRQSGPSHRAQSSLRFSRRAAAGHCRGRLRDQSAGNRPQAPHACTYRRSSRSSSTRACIRSAVGGSWGCGSERCCTAPAPTPSSPSAAAAGALAAGSRVARAR